MAYEFVDPVSGHPYAFVPSTDVPHKAVKGWIDLHHAAHPKKAQQLQGERGQAVRDSIGQLVSWEDHHMRWHRDGYEPDTLPETDDDACRYVAFAVAGYLHKGFCFQRREIKVVTLNGRQRERLWSSGERGVINPGSIRNFVVSHVMDQPLAEADAPLEQQFLEERNPGRVREFGHQVLALKVHRAVDGFADDYVTAHEEGLLHPAAPERPSQLVHDLIGDFSARDRIVHLLHRNGQLVD